MYIDEKFLLKSDLGRKIYQDYAKDMPIYDYHCHLSPKEIAEDKKYRNMAEIWLSADHYKWRAMRINGIEEKFVSGDGADYDKFLNFARTLEYAIGNPLYQWSHLELSKYFGINELLDEKSATKIWEEANDKLKNISTRTLIKDSKVTHICTTDDPTDDLKYHKVIAEDNTFDTGVYPTFRPDNGFRIEKIGFNKWIEKLMAVENKSIQSIDDLTDLLKNRVEYFNANGCKLADHGYEDFLFTIPNKQKANETLQKRLNSKELTHEEIINFRSYVIVFLAEVYEKLDWTMQMHIGAIRNSNSAMFEKVGADAGFDCMGDYDMALHLCKYLDFLNAHNSLPKTILYNLNAKDNDVFASMMGNYPKANVPLRTAFGTAWWFYDQKNGIENQIKSFANFGLLGRFLGMVTDSRSFLSFTRHDYFRRVACNLIGTMAESGDIPQNEAILESLVKNISYNNAYNYFGLK